jgi:hypothetical protein
MIRGDKRGAAQRGSREGLAGNQKHLYARLMEIFARYGAHVDHEVGGSRTRPPMDFSCLPPFKFTAKLGKSR